ncbi:MAG: hypothetical protein ACRDLB_10530, partial [Actinomycetota bacterium]
MALILMLLLPAAALGKPGKGKNENPGNGKPPWKNPPPATEAPSGSATTLVLYDTSGNWGWMGEKYAIASANLAGHFGSYDTKPVQEYTAGEMANYTAVIYIGSSYDEPLPNAFLDDTLAGKGNVVWAGWNIWQLSNRAGADAFKAKYGWLNGFFNNDDIPQV